MKAVLGALTATLIGIVIALLGAEAASRLIMPNWSEFASERFMKPTYQQGFGSLALGIAGFDGWFAQNNGDFRIHIHVDSSGLRNPDDANPDGALWAIGDSFTFGWGVARDEVFGAVAAARLNLPFFSVASPGTDVCGYMALLARQPAQRRPRAVVLGLTIENDLIEYEQCDYGPPVASPPIRIVSKSAAKDWLLSHSAFYNLAATTMKRSPVLLGLLQSVGVIERELNVSWHTARHPAAVLNGTAAAVARLRAMLPPDTPFVVVLIPARFDLREDRGEWSADREELVRALTAKGLNIVDPAAALRHAGADKVHFTHDGHWSALGHRVAGEMAAVALSPLLKRDSSR